MSKSINKVFLLGSCGRDAEIRFTTNGAIVATVSLATSERYKDPQGNWQDRTEWHSLAAYGKQAEFARDYIKKGAKLHVEGKLQTRSWEKNGITQYHTEIIVREWILLSEWPEKLTQAGSSYVPQPTVTAAPPPVHKTLTEELMGTEFTEEDVPF